MSSQHEKSLSQVLGGAQKTSASDIEDHLDTVPAIKLLAASWAALLKDGMKTSAAKVEEIGNLAYGDGCFKAAMSDAVGGPLDNA
ncbi:hypothetical protein B0A55_01514 [Friedmanniomyces simplex]|uniref:Uncharacterized protein n=1 Tax=Friedmanniomyces simplex TaxID=329884 RepID=A0A4U0Y032_9PEZI|nr:hypothetical protein B0A55_01514 [Friedmanniomyces simplex]